MNTISPFQPNSRVCAYLRDSGGTDQDLSVEQQESEVHDWCEANNLALTQIFRDTATPGSSVIGREAFLAMIAHFHDDPPENGLVIWRFSRFARDFDDSQFYKADLRRRGYEIYSIKDQVPDGSTGRLLEAVLDWANERFLEDLSADVRRGLVHLMEQYGALGGFPPFGFHREAVEIGTRRDGRPHVVCRWRPDTDPDLRARIRTAWQMRAEGATYVEIHHQLGLLANERGYSRVFRNALYKGVMVFSGREYPGYCESLIDECTWDQVQQRHRRRRTQ